MPMMERIAQNRWKKSSLDLHSHKCPFVGMPDRDYLLLRLNQQWHREIQLKRRNLYRTIIQVDSSMLPWRRKNKETDCRRLCEFSSNRRRKMFQCHAASSKFPTMSQCFSRSKRNVEHRKKLWKGDLLMMKICRSSWARNYYLDHFHHYYFKVRSFKLN